MREDVVLTGIWKFGSNLSLTQLLELANSWLVDKDGKKYFDLHVRKYGKNPDCYAIGFKYELDDPDDHKKFFYKMTDKLKRQFGNDLVGWDISFATWALVHRAIGAQQMANKPLTFGELTIGSKFILFPLADDDSGHGGFRSFSHLYTKVDPEGKGKNARRESDQSLIYLNEDTELLPVRC